MRPNSRRLLATAASGLAMLACLSGPRAALAEAQAEQAEPGPGEGLISVQFPGGSVAEYVELIRRVMRPRPANIALSESAAGATLPPVQLDSVTLATALGAIQYIAPMGEDEHWVIMPLSGQMNGAQWNGVQMSGEEPPAFAVTLVRRVFNGATGQVSESTSPASSGGNRILQVYSIKELIEPPTPGGPTPETVLTAVDLALRMDDSSGREEPIVKFHPESGLVILDAHPQQVGAIEGLLTRMRDDVFRQRDRLERARREQQGNDVILQSAAVKIDSCAARLDLAKEALDAVLERQRSGAASTDEVRSVQMAVVEAKGDRDMAEVELRAAKARIDGQADGPTVGGDADALRAQVAQLNQQVAVLQAKIKELESRKK